MSAVAVTIHNPVPDEFYTDLPVGEILRRARLQMGLSLPQAETHLHIQAAYLEALEKSDFDSLPGRTYVIGFIRTYAEFLNLDGARVVHLLKRQSSGLGTPQALNAHMLPSDNRLPSVPVAAACVAGLLLLAVLWVGYQNTRVGAVNDEVGATPSDQKNLQALERLADPITIDDIVAEVTERENTGGQSVGTAQEGASDTAAVNAASIVEGSTSQPDLTALPLTTQEMPGANTSPSKGVVITIRKEGWLEIRAPDGKVTDARMFAVGETVPIPNPVDEFGNSYVITIGNAGGVEISVDGKTLPPLGADGQVRRNISLNPKTLKLLIGSP